MTVVAPPPNPSLVAIILLVQARSGPRFVYHYPPAPYSRPSATLSSDGDLSHLDVDNSSNSDEDLFDEKPNRRAHITDEDDEDSQSQEMDEQKHGGCRVPWERLLGLDTSALERLLVPSDRNWHKRRFEVGFNELVFLGWPVFIREDGTWRKKRRKERVSRVRSEEVEVSQDLQELPEGRTDAQVPVDDLGENDSMPPVTTDADSARGVENREMTVFNLVFVLNPPILEYNLRVKEMYEYVVKKFGRALKWEQARGNYVWEQSQIILKAKTQARRHSLYPGLPCCFMC